MHSGTKRWIEITLLIGAVLIAILMITGYNVETAARQHDRDRLPPQVGKSIDIGGRTLNIYCSGEGSPAVILESGGGGPGYGWVLVQPGIARFTRACWYDRAGEGWSDSPPAPRTSTTITNDLHELLQRAGVKPPYVLVGASIGGEYARIFTAKFPEDVAGLVLVDSSHPDQREPEIMKGPMNRIPVSVRRFICAATPAVARFGVARLAMRTGRRFATPELSPNQQAILAALNSQPRNFFVSGAQACQATKSGAVLPETGTGNPEVDDAARHAGSLGDRPLVVLTAGKFDTPPDPVVAREVAEFHKVWVNQLQADLAHLSTRGKQVVVQNSGHGIQLEAPDVVVKAVREVVDEVRAGSSAPRAASARQNSAHFARTRQR